MSTVKRTFSKALETIKEWGGNDDISDLKIASLRNKNVKSNIYLGIIIKHFTMLICYTWYLFQWITKSKIHHYFTKHGFPTPGIEPGPAGWEPAILTTRPYGILRRCYV